MYQDEKIQLKRKHNLILEGRKILNVTGVVDVSGFNDERVVLTTDMGELTVSGEHLHINKFSQETGELNLDGEICALIYTDQKKDEGGFFSKIFK